MPYHFSPNSRVLVDGMPFGMLHKGPFFEHTLIGIPRRLGPPMLEARNGGLRTRQSVRSGCRSAGRTFLKCDRAVSCRTKTAQNRFQMLMMQGDFYSNVGFRLIRDQLDGACNFDGISKAQQAEYATFFEDLALLCRSKLVKPELAFYMFAFEASRCWKNDNFWDEAGPKRKMVGSLASFRC